jgi:hypothetical protein
MNGKVRIVDIRDLAATPGMTASSIARRLNVSIGSIVKLARGSGIALPDRATANRLPAQRAAVQRPRPAFGAAMQARFLDDDYRAAFIAKMRDPELQKRRIATRRARAEAKLRAVKGFGS